MLEVDTCNLLGTFYVLSDSLPSLLLSFRPLNLVSSEDSVFDLLLNVYSLLGKSILSHDLNSQSHTDNFRLYSSSLGLFF